MSEWNIGPFDFEYIPDAGRLTMWYENQYIEAIDVPEYNLPAAKIQAANLLLKRLNEWKFHLFEYLKDLKLADMVAEGNG